MICKEDGYFTFDCPSKKNGKSVRIVEEDIEEEEEVPSDLSVEREEEDGDGVHMLQTVKSVHFICFLTLLS